MIIKGQTVILYEKTEKGVDDFNKTLYTETPVEVSNVLIAPMSEEEILDVLNLTGKRAIYQLAIPKGDTHDWEDKKVEFWGKNWRVIGKPIEGQEELIPLLWNKKVRVESV
jgi:hypothetical protein